MENNDPFVESNLQTGPKSCSGISSCSREEFCSHLQTTLTIIVHFLRSELGDQPFHHALASDGSVLSESDLFVLFPGYGYGNRKHHKTYLGTFCACGCGKWTCWEFASYSACHNMRSDISSCNGHHSWTVYVVSPGSFVLCDNAVSDATHPHHYHNKERCDADVCCERRSPAPTLSKIAKSCLHKLGVSVFSIDLKPFFVCIEVTDTGTTSPGWQGPDPRDRIPVRSLRFAARGRDTTRIVRKKQTVNFPQSKSRRFSCFPLKWCCCPT